MGEEKPILMQCGHPGTAVDIHGRPYCAYCDRISDSARRPFLNQGSMLKGRKARCVRCGRVVSSETALRNNTGTFQLNSKEKEDSFWCGCEPKNFRECDPECPK